MLDVIANIEDRIKEYDDAIDKANNEYSSTYALYEGRHALSRLKADLENQLNDVIDQMAMEVAGV